MEHIKIEVTTLIFQFPSALLITVVICMKGLCHTLTCTLAEALRAHLV